MPFTPFLFPMTTPSLRFGIHDFLNARPLLVPLKEKASEAGFQIVTDTPSALADRLKSGDVDLAMIPSVEYFKSADSYRLVPDVCIASRGQVGTVLLLAKKPLAEITSVAVDVRSRTSVALLKILFPFSSDTKIYPVAPDLESMLAEHAAAMIIGDRALTLGDPGPGITVYDLSEEWFRQTGKTFVHAVVAVRQGINLDRARQDFIQQAKQEGRKRIKEIVRAHTELARVDTNVLEDYLENKIRYDLKADEMAGLTHFSHLCHEHGIIPEKISLQLI